MRYVRDIRTPADPQDFESLYGRSAAPPLDVRVKKDVGDTLCIFEFLDFAGPVDRNPTVGYRAYFVPMTTATVTQLAQSENRKAALRTGRLCGEVSPSGRGGWIKLSSPDFSNIAGHFMAVGVNRRGIESDPTIAFPSPYNP